MTEATKTSSSTSPILPDFSLFDEGSCLGMEKAVRQLWSERFTPWQKVHLAVLATWLPMVVLSALQGRAIGPTRPESFLLDGAMYGRYLVALPLLILTPLRCRRTFQKIVQQFLNARLVKESEHERFRASIASTMRLRYAPLADWLLLTLAYGYSAFTVLVSLPDFPASWRTVGSEGTRTLSLAGWWWLAVCEPLVLFVLLRFLYRVGLWWKFLWETSRLDLQLKAAHPDGAGGLMFLGLSLSPLEMPAFAIAASIAGALANVVLATGASVYTFRYPILVVVVVIVALLAGPLGFFTHRLKKAREQASLSYGRAAQQQLSQFEKKWVDSLSGDTEMLSTGDFSAVIDLNSTVASVHRMSFVPFRRNQFLGLILAAVLPFVPVAALQIPLRDLLSLFKMLR